LRYIDIFCIWPGPPEELNYFLNYLNKAHPTIKFTHVSSTKSVDFLDLTIYKGLRHTNSGILDLKPFFKKTNKFQYLQYSSAHPSNTFPSLVKGELTRLLRNCSDEETYKQVSDKILKDRGYPNNILQHTLKQVPFTHRTELLNRNKESKTNHDTFLKVNYTPNLDTMALRKILKPTRREKGKVPNPCLSLSKGKSIAKKLVRAKLKQYPNPPISTNPTVIKTAVYEGNNSMPCRTADCKCCDTISQKCRVTSTHNNKTYTTQKYTSCSTKNIIYLIECTKCTKGNQYVGRTSETLRTKLNQHITHSTTKTNFPLYRHFLQRPDHNFKRDTRITILQATTRTRVQPTV